MTESNTKQNDNEAADKTAQDDASSQGTASQDSAESTSPEVIETPIENPLEIPLEIPRAVARKEKRAARKLLKQEKRKTENLSRRTRLLDSSEFKRQAYYALENMRQGKAVTKLVGFFLFVLIVANAVLVFLSAQPNLEPLAANILKGFFIFSTICFFLEYIARIWIADLVYGDCTPTQARTRYIFSALGIIDFLSFAPSMLAWFLPVTPALIHSVNVLRLIRLVKVTRYMRGFRTMEQVFRKHSQEIVASFLVIFLLIIVTSVVMYEVEHAAQPEKFTSLFQGVWFAVETVTSTGYGDIVPITSTGKVCAMIIMMLSLGVIAIPGGIFSAGFVAEFQNANMRRIERDAARDQNNNGANDAKNDRHGDSRSHSDPNDSDESDGPDDSDENEDQ